jgi:hypothetical protein
MIEEDGQLHTLGLLEQLRRNRDVEGGIGDRNARRRRDHPSNVLIASIPQLDMETTGSQRCREGSGWLVSTNPTVQEAE